MKDKLKKGLAIGLIGIAGISAATAIGFGGKGFGNEPINENPELQTAIDNNDYDAFMSALSSIDSEAALRFTQERFENMVLRHEAREDIQKAIENDDYNAFIEALNEKNENRLNLMTEERFAEMVQRNQNHQAIEDAIEAEDYEAWIEAVSKMPRAGKMSEVVTEEDFDTLIQIHNLRENGEFAEARVLADELGLPGKQESANGKDKSHRGFEKSIGKRNVMKN